MESHKYALPEGYLEAREEMNKRDAAKGEVISRRLSLQAGLNRFFETGIREYSKNDIGALGRNDWPMIEAKLNEWKQRGLVRFIKPLSTAADRELVIEMLDFIDIKNPELW